MEMLNDQKVEHPRGILRYVSGIFFSYMCNCKKPFLFGFSVGWKISRKLICVISERTFDVFDIGSTVYAYFMHSFDKKISF